MPEDITIDSRLGPIQTTYRPGDRMVVFSHGFGVKRDSRGMFTQIADSLGPDWGSILFDFNQIDGDIVSLRPYSTQTVMLQSVLAFAQERAKEVVLIGHSMGAITASLLNSIIPKTSILLAPPVHGPRPNASHSWAERPGAYYENDTLVVPRKDGTTSRIPKAFFDESSRVDCPAVIEEYAQHNDVYVIQALDEDILSHTENYDELRLPKGHLIRLRGNHNFDEPHRKSLIETILTLL